MRIAIVTNSAWSAFNFRLNLANAFKEKGYDVIFIIPFDNNYSEKLKKGFKCYNLLISPKSTNPINELITFINLHKLYKLVGPDIICHFTIKLNIYGSFSAKFLKIPSIANITGLGTLFIRQSFMTSLSEFLYKLSLKSVTKVFFQNKEDLKYFLEKEIITIEQTQLLPGSGVDLNKFKFKPKVNNSDKFVFLVVSRLLADKGIYEYIDSIKLIKKNFPGILVEFQLLGEVNSKNRTAIKALELEEWVKKGYVNYLGVTDEVEKYILDSNCIVLPSYREGMPRCILEAFAIGRPVIASDVPGCRHIVDDKSNGLLCKVKSSEDLSIKMIRMMNLSKDERDLFALNGRKKVESFFDEKIVINYYHEVIKNIDTYEKNL
jgi:glycosyltransferase involved in cell wall biosynthesis